MDACVNAHCTLVVREKRHKTLLEWRLKLVHGLHIKPPATLSLGVGMVLAPGLCKWRMRLMAVVAPLESPPTLQGPG